MEKLTIDFDNYWSTLLWAMADGKKTEYDALKRTLIGEFYPLYDRWVEQNKPKTPTANNE